MNFNLNFDLIQNKQILFKTYSGGKYTTFKSKTKNHGKLKIYI